MKKTDVIFSKNPGFYKIEDFMNEYLKAIDKKVNEGYEIKASNIAVDNNQVYYYVLFEKDE